jgi:hypothetical protein
MMFVCALLVRKGGKSKTSNVGDQGQDVITMTDEAACLPLYLIETSCDMGMAGAMMPGMAGGAGGAGGGAAAFTGRSMRLGGRSLSVAMGAVATVDEDM